MKISVWFCKIGCLTKKSIVSGGDAPMRHVVEKEFKRLVSVENDFCFSGWESNLNEIELAVIENRLPKVSNELLEIAEEFRKISKEVSLENKSRATEIIKELNNIILIEKLKGN